MKKLLTVLILMTVIIVPSFAAVTDMMVNIGLMNTSSVLSIEPEKDKVFDFNIDLQADFNLIFDNGPGVDISLTALQNFNELELGVYYSHMIDVRNNFDIIVSVGPSFQLMNDFAIGVDAKVNFLIDITDSFYVNIGTGALMDIVSFSKNADPDVNFTVEIPLPSVALGLRF